MKKTIIAMFLMLCSLLAKPTIEFSDALKISLFEQDFEVEHSLIKDYEAQIVYDKCVSEYISEYSSPGYEIRFSEPNIPNCDVKFAKNYVITNLKISTKYFDELLKNEEIKELFETNKDKLNKIILDARKDSKKEFANITTLKLKAGLESNPVIKTYTFNIEESYVINIENPFNEMSIKSFNLSAFTLHPAHGNGGPYRLRANITITAFDPSNSDLAFAIVDDALKNRENKYKNEDLVRNIKNKDEKLFEKLKANRQSYNLPKNSALIKDNQPQTLEMLPTSNQDVNFTNQEMEPKDNKTIDFSK